MLDVYSNSDEYILGHVIANLLMSKASFRFEPVRYVKHMHEASAMKGSSYFATLEPFVKFQKHSHTQLLFWNVTTEGTC